MSTRKQYAGPVSQVVGGSVLALTRAGGRVARRLARPRPRQTSQPSPEWPALEPAVPEPAVQPEVVPSPEATAPEPVAAEPEPEREPEPKARKTTRSKKSSKPQPPEGFVPISERPFPDHDFVPGPYSLEVVGESFVKANLEALVGVPAPEQGRTYTSGRFQLVPYQNPHDPRAIEVRELTTGLPVGHLPREVAGKLHGPLAKLAQRAGRPVAVSGTIFGAEGRYGVRVFVDLERIVKRRVARKVPHRRLDRFPLGDGGWAHWNGKRWVFD